MSFPMKLPKVPSKNERQLSLEKTGRIMHRPSSTDNSKSFPSPPQPPSSTKIPEEPYFSNGWKIQPVIFPTIGKFYRLFPAIGKNLRRCFPEKKTTHPIISGNTGCQPVPHTLATCTPALKRSTLFPSFLPSPFALFTFFAAGKGDAPHHSHSCGRCRRA